MAKVTKLLDFLDNKGVEYELVRHPHSDSSLATAEKAHIPGGLLAKAVVLKDDAGCVVAVVPATYHVEPETLGRELGRHLRLASESEFETLFPDCEPGAVPPLADLYGHEVVIDDSLKDAPEVYLEAGDHERLVHLRRRAFTALFDRAHHGRFAHHV